ncbi:hypothetical protein TIFTF001_005284 [Ficus carica]|uniref:Uncharacterized protein n=1 Tax=Ficus carica TaxID=3494 RepID=A0AA88CZ82_FICCA|nr:hypothetical protein TIFTF001_005284 [Ficus carica]
MVGGKRDPISYSFGEGFLRLGRSEVFTGDGGGSQIWTSSDKFGDFSNGGAISPCPPTAALTHPSHGNENHSALPFSPDSTFLLECPKPHMGYRQPN